MFIRDREVREVSAVVCIIDNTESKLNSGISVFGKGELSRLEKIKNPRRRAESAAGLLCLRSALEYLNIYRADESFDIVRDENGRPSFRRSDLPDFSIAHDGILSLAAVSKNDERVGVDIEELGSSTDARATDSQIKLSQRFFSDDEKERFRRGDLSSDEFFRIWTAKEAYAKQCGKGMAKILAKESACAPQKNESFFFSREIGYRSARYMLTLCSDKNEEPNIIWC